MRPASTVISLSGPRGQKVAHNIQTVRSTQSPIQMTAGLLHQQSRCVADRCYHLVPKLKYEELYLHPQHVFIAWRLRKEAIYNFRKKTAHTALFLRLKDARDGPASRYATRI